MYMYYTNVSTINQYRFVHEIKLIHSSYICTNIIMIINL